MADEVKQGTLTLSAEEKVYSLFAYFGVLCLVSLLLRKDSEFVRFHVKQGLVLFIIETVVGVFNIVPILGYIIFMLVMLVCGLVSIIGMIQALMGNRWDMPFISEWAKKITL